MDIEVKVADGDTWGDVLEVLGPRGGYGGCWCLFWRLTNQEADGKTADDMREALHALVTSPEPVGLLLYHDTSPVGWCQVAPRPGFRRLFRTQALDLDDADDPAVWSVTCIYITRTARRLGAAQTLLDAAVDHATRHGAAALEGYPVTDAGSRKTAQLSTGTISLFSRAGFTMIGQPTGRRVVMRRDLKAGGVAVTESLLRPGAS